MPRRRKNRKMKIGDRSDRYTIINTLTYMHRHISSFPYMELDEDFFGLFSFGVNNSTQDFIDRILGNLNSQQIEEYEDIIGSCIDRQSRFQDIMPCILERAPRFFVRKIQEVLLDVLNERIESLDYKGQSELEKNLQAIKKMFNLTDQESDFCLFLYILYTNPKLHSFFVDELNCQKLNGRKYLASALALTKNQLHKVLTGTLYKIGFFEMDSESLNIDCDFLFLFEGIGTGNIIKQFFSKLSRIAIPLDHHLTVKNEIGDVLELLKTNSKTATHILLYGSPGTGKSSFAKGISKELTIPAYEIRKHDDNTTQSRRAAILACQNMTGTGDGSLIVIDEADNILNTGLSWFFRGETQDKGWLNHLLEQHGTRMIWITNEIKYIEPSVLRRFAFSLHFKPFNKRQRVLVWDNIVRKNRAKRFFKEPDIIDFAKHKVSPGAIDLAVRKAIEAQPKSKEKCHQRILKALEAHEILLNSGNKEIDKNQIERQYSLDGLNVNVDIKTVLTQLEKFDEFLRNPRPETIINMNLLFHGPPGTGKSELARYIGQCLSREIISKRVSDIQSAYVGESEQNIRDAFEEAEREDAVLIIDEADSLLFSRDRAVRSWEISFTNEFLTRMERFNGILICTTNRLKDLDQASLRRFQHKIGFDYVDSNGNIIFYDKLLKGLTYRVLDPESEAILKGIANLAPGDFKTVRDRFAFYPKEGLTPEILIEALKNEADVKKVFNKGSSIGF